MSDVTIWVYDHPYYSAGAGILALFIIGFLFSILGYIATGASVVGKTVYYVSYPVHAPIRYAYNKLNESP